MIVYHVIMQETRPPELMAREWTPIMRDTQATAAKTWHKSIFPLHFRAPARAVYGFQRRSARYAARKRELALHGKAIEGGLIDLVKTGRMRQQLTTIGVVRPQTAKAILEMVGPRYTTLRRAGSPDKVAELTKLTSGETAQLAKGMQRELTKRVNELHSTKTTKA